MLILALIYILEQDYPCFSRSEPRYVHCKLSPQDSRTNVRRTGRAIHKSYALKITCSDGCMWFLKNKSSLYHYHHHKEPSLSICLADTGAQCPAEMQMKAPPPHACRERAGNSAPIRVMGFGRVFAQVRHAPLLANSTPSRGSWDLGCSPCLGNKASPRLYPGIQCLTLA